MNAHQNKCRAYIAARRSSYWFRCRRYRAVAERLFKMGLQNKHTLLDLGAGRADFDYYLRRTWNWKGIYVPVDGGIDGTDLEHWGFGDFQPDFCVAIEVIEHLEFPLNFCIKMQQRTKIGIVVTTPNPRTTDVIAMDNDHKTAVPRASLEFIGMRVKEKSFFGKHRDSLLAWSPAFRYDRPHLEKFVPKPAARVEVAI